MYKILIVDNQLATRELARLSLELADCYVLEADHGQEAFKLAQLERPDLIFLSITAPGGAMTILEIIQRLKAEPDTASIKIVLLATRGQDQDIQAGLAAGADDYFIKPFAPLSLIQKVEEILERI